MSFRDRLKGLLGSARSNKMLALVAPPRGQSVITRVFVLGGALVGLAAMGALAGGALVLLFMALGVIYWILTSVLGLKLAVDPQAAYEAFAKASQPRA
jgi:hypothetical protein